MAKYNRRNISNLDLLTNFAQVLLALATIYLTYTISEKQNRISKLEYAPLFVLDIDQIYTKDFIPTGSENIKITNEGYAVNNYSSKVNSILTIYYSIDNKDSQMIYNLDYFSVQSRKSGGKGEMASGVGVDNIKTLKKIKDDTRKLLEGYHLDYLNFELKHIIKINYTDIEMDKGTTFFVDTKAVNSEEYNKLERKINNKELISLGQLQEENLAKKIIESIPIK